MATTRNKNAHRTWQLSESKCTWLLESKNAESNNLWEAKMLRDMSIVREEKWS